MSKHTGKGPHKGRGYTPKPTAQPKQKNKAVTIAAGVIAVVTIALIAYPYFVPSKETETKTNSGLQIIDRVIGTGPSPTKGRQVIVHYTGTLENGKKFDSSVDRGQPFPFTIGVGQVIMGWDEGVMTMKVGGKRKLIIPPHLGYGAQGAPPDIPPNATLIFEVELIDVK